MLLLFDIVEYNHRAIVYNKAAVASGFMSLPITTGSILFLKAREILPLIEIVEVRRAIEVADFSQRLRIRTVGGEVIDVNPSEFEAFSENPTFKGDDFVLRNQDARLPAGPKLIKRRLAVGFLLVLVPPGLLMSSLLTSGRLEEAMFNFMLFNIAVTIVSGLFFVVCLVVAMGIVGWISGRQQRRWKGLEFTDAGICVPWVLGLKRRIPDSSIDSIYISGSGIGYHIEVRSGWRRISLPLEARLDLRAAGYTINDPMNVLVGL